MLKGLKILLLLLCLGMASESFAQVQLWQKAQIRFQEDSLLQAKELIDQSVESSREQNEPFPWYLRGHVYLKLLKTDQAPDVDAYRKAVVESFKQSIKLDSLQEFKSRSQSGIKSIAIMYYNQCVTELGKMKTDNAEPLLEKYNETMRVLNPTFYSPKNELPIYQRLGVIYMERYEFDTEANQNYFDKALHAFEKVLEIDSNDFSSNLNSGVLYHNKGVALLMKINGDLSFAEVMDIEEQHINNMERAKAFMEKAYSLRKNHAGVIRGLAGIYYTLHNEEKFAYFNEKLLKLEGDK